LYRVQRLLGDLRTEEELHHRADCRRLRRNHVERWKQ